MIANRGVGEADTGWGRRFPGKNMRHPSETKRESNKPRTSRSSSIAVFTPEQCQKVYDQLTRIFESPQFTRNERRREFLRHVVEETLAGRAGLLKGYSIALTIFARDESFDPATDPIVRLEARRLRQELEHYYLTEGIADPIVISIPKGSYAADFSFLRETDEAVVSPAKVAPAILRLDNAAVPLSPVHKQALLALVAITAGLAAWACWDFAVKHGSRIHVAAESDAPVISVLPIRVTDEMPKTYHAALGMREDVLTTLCGLDGIQIFVDDHEYERLLLDQPDARMVGSDRPFAYALQGHLQSLGDVLRLNSSLIDVRTNLIVWSARFDYEASQRLERQVSIAGEIKSAISTALLGDSVELVSLVR